MKTSQDPRHIRRKNTIRELFADTFAGQKIQTELTGKVLEKKPDIDKLIESAAPAWPINKLNRVDLAVLRLAVYELMYENNTPPKVIIDEAVELAKEYGAESSPGFVNGVLGTVLKARENHE